ncbi:hypothetical protein D0Z00_003765 [Geotrichum galactomycetum]|uniref:Uncharacterized protein n=1 Tax=Geotrichum galactomycetum TaxID=27317 RepID=A0ACB6V0F4_9ASCO|nr:hypothetical protein D0Z00_003765 [Geotrichum candidum]
MVRKAIAISCLRTFSNMELAIKSQLTFSTHENQLFDWDETTAGNVASRMVPAIGRYPADIGRAILDTGVLSPKFIKSSVIDIIYQDSPLTNDLNNELVYLFGHQLEHLFDPLAEYSPETTEMLYTPPTYPPMQRPSDTDLVQSVCEELFSIHSHFTTDLLNLLQDFLIPLRVKVLSGDIPGVNMRILNTIFPPTIDEVVRVNNIFYEALDLALPYGSYEVIKACGISIPYFYKACMRHEATTRNFSANLRQHYDLIMANTRTLGRFTINRIESIIHCSLHLTKIKMVLDRLVKLVQWRDDEVANIEEFYQSAVGTIDSFGKESFISPYDNRIFTPTGKLLVEISKGWPKELEYGWINRRVVTIFDAVGIMQDQQDVHNVVFVFTDSVVVIKPQEAISITSDSGIHRPSVADMLMHSMINSVPLPNLPELNVVGWAPIDNVYMAEVEGAQSLAMYITGAGFTKSATESSNLELFRLISPDVTASSIVNFLSKAKIMNKTQPFHLFLNQQQHFSIFATVQEYQGYVNEVRKCPIAIFANMHIPDTILETHDLVACIGTQIFDTEHVSITVMSKLAYNTHEIVLKTEFSAAIASQVSRLYSLYFASSNPFAAEMTIKNNSSIANYLIKYATAPRKQMKLKSNKLRVTIKEPNEPNLKRQPSLRQRLSPVTAKVTTTTSTTPNPSTHVTPLLSSQHKLSKPKLLTSTKLTSSQQNLVEKGKTSFSDVFASAPPQEHLNHTERVGASQNADSVASSRFSHAIKDSERVSDTGSVHNTSRSSLVPVAVTGQMTTINSVVSVASWSTDKAGKDNTTHIEDLTAISLDTTGSFITVSDLTSIGAGATSDKGYSASDSNNSIQKSSNHNISVEEWYQDLVANNRDSLGSSLDSVPGIDAIETTFEDEDEDEAAEGADALTDLTESMRNLTEFIGDKHSPPSCSEDSVLLADDFSYLAGMVSSTEQNNVSRTGSLYPDIRESSVLFLGNYNQARDDPVTKQTSIESLGAFASIQQQQQQQMPRSYESHDTSVERIIETRRYKPGQVYSGPQRPGDNSVVIISDDEDEDLSFYHDCNDDSTGDIDSILRVNQQMIVHQHNTAKTPSPAQHLLGQATPQLSATELKLRALTVNLEGLARGAEDRGAGALAAELNRVSATTLHLYKGTRGLATLPATVAMLTPSDQQRVANVERGNRTLLMAGLWTLVAITGHTNKGSRAMIQAYLDIEWDRRTILHEKMGPAIPPQLWQV